MANRKAQRLSPLYCWRAAITCLITDMAKPFIDQMAVPDMHADSDIL